MEHTMLDILICLDDSGNADGPITDGPKDEPVWSLYANDRPGPYWEEWDMTLHGSGLTYRQALLLADELGLYGHLVS
jgi:hypothetical protein